MFSTTFVVCLVALVILLFLISVRIIFVKGGEFRGSCSTNNEFLRREGAECAVCGKPADEACPNSEEGKTVSA